MPKPTKIFPKETEQFIVENHLHMTYNQLQEITGISITRINKKLQSLGFKIIHKTSWTTEQVDFLKNNFRRIGNKDLAVIYNKKWPKQIAWKSSNFKRKLQYMKLKRNKLDLFCIKESYRKRGSWGPPDLKRNPKPPKVFLKLDDRTTIILTEKSNVDTIIEKYQNRNQIHKSFKSCQHNTK